MFDKAALFTYTAPPPLFAAPGWTDDGLVTAEQLEKFDREIMTEKFDPVTFVGINAKLKFGENIQGLWRMETAPPNTDEEPKDPEDPRVDEVARQFVQLIENKLTIEFRTKIISTMLADSL
jgi:hypothetical protein